MAQQPDMPRRLASMLVDVLRQEDVSPQLASEACALALAEMITIEQADETDDRTVMLRVRTLAYMTSHQVAGWLLYRVRHFARVER